MAKVVFTGCSKLLPVLLFNFSTFQLFNARSAVAAPVEVDKAAHSVTLEVVSTDPGIAAPVEFFLAGPDSDHDYESLFLTVAPVADVAKAFSEAGFPMGRPLDYRACRFWPVGATVEIEPGLWTLIKDTRDEAKPEAVFTGGARDAKGLPLAAKDSPNAVFALYDCPQSLILFDDSLAQSVAYGRFVPAVEIPKGEKRRIKFTLKSGTEPERVQLKLDSSNIAAAFAALREKSLVKSLDVETDFAPSMTIEEAAAAAAALEAIDSSRVRINGFAPGQFFYRSYMPLEKWRDRKERLVQPYELRLGENGEFSLTVVEEDWKSDPDATDPILHVKENVPFSSIGKPGDETDTALVFVPAGTKLERLYALRKLLPPRVANYYFYCSPKS